MASSTEPPRVVYRGNSLAHEDLSALRLACAFDLPLGAVCAGHVICHSTERVKACEGDVFKLEPGRSYTLVPSSSDGKMLSDVPASRSALL